jgi:hypothetical protein
LAPGLVTGHPQIGRQQAQVHFVAVLAGLRRLAFGLNFWFFAR